jgi:hypothetical protein
MALNLWLSREGRWSNSACMGCIDTKIAAVRERKKSTLAIEGTSVDIRIGAVELKFISIELVRRHVS